MPRHLIEPFPELLTNRLVLRQLEPADAGAVFLLRSNPEVNLFVDRPLMPGPEDGLRFIKRINISISEGDCLFWAIVPKQQEDLIGSICIWNWNRSRHQAELSFELLPPWQGKGLMHEALLRVIEFAFSNLKLEKLEAWVNQENHRSIRVLRKFQFHRAPLPVRATPDTDRQMLQVFELKAVQYTMTDQR